MNIGRWLDYLKLCKAGLVWHLGIWGISRARRMNLDFLALNPHAIVVGNDIAASDTFQSHSTKKSKLLFSQVNMIVCS